MSQVGCIGTTCNTTTSVAIMLDPPYVEESLLLGTGRSGCAPGVAVTDPANPRTRHYLAQLGWLNRPAIRGVAVQ